MLTPSCFFYLTEQKDMPMSNTVKDLVRYIQDKHYAGDSNSLADSESVGCALHSATDLDKAKLALALLESITDKPKATLLAVETYITTLEYKL